MSLEDKPIDQWPGDGDYVDPACEVTIARWDDAHDGPGFYYYDPEYPDEGSVGAFPSYEDALNHLTEAGLWTREPSP